MSDENKKISVLSIKQSGGITAHTVNINAAPEPQIRAEEIFLNQAQGSEYHSRIALTVESPYPPANLFVALFAPSVKSIDLDPQRTGIVMMGHCGTRQGMAFANLQNPFGLVHLNVITSEPESLKIEWQFT